MLWTPIPHPCPLHPGQGGPLIPPPLCTGLGGTSWPRPPHGSNQVAGTGSREALPEEATTSPCPGWRSFTETPAGPDSLDQNTIPKVSADSPTSRNPTCPCQVHIPASLWGPHCLPPIPDLSPLPIPTEFQFHFWSNPVPKSPPSNPGDPSAPPVSES